MELAPVYPKLLPPPNPKGRVAYESGCWFFRDPVFDCEWSRTTDERMALRWAYLALVYIGAVEHDRRYPTRAQL